MKKTAQKGVPPKGCRKCPRLVDYRKTQKASQPDWYNGAIPPWGRVDAPILIVGLAPGLKGANRTGRIFTGDSSGAFLFQALIENGYVTGNYHEDGEKAPSDNLVSKNVRITNTLACVPPQNKPTTDELNNCAPFLSKQIETMTALKAILCLGTLAHRACLRAFGYQQSHFPFRHGARHMLERNHLKKCTERQNLALFDSYHCSKYNTQTGRLNHGMFRKILNDLQVYIDESG